LEQKEIISKAKYFNPKEPQNINEEKIYWNINKNPYIKD
jgi:hypothetical protein